MGRKVCWGLLAGLAVAMLSLEVWAGEPKKGEGPRGFAPGNPEALFNRLDKNHDGFITADEIPPGAPEPLKAFLQRADKTGDKKLTLQELKEAWKAGPPGPPWAGRVGPLRGPQGQIAGPRPPERSPAGPPPSHGGPFQLPDLKTLFAKMDKNHDGSLSLDEFVSGMTELHQRMRERFASASAERPRQPPGPGAAPAGSFGPGAGRPGMAGPPRAGWGRGPMVGFGPWHMPPAWCPCPWCRFGAPSRSPPPWRGPESWGKGPGPRPDQPPPFAQPGGPGEEHLRRLVAKLVREELAKIVKQKAEAARPQPPHHDRKAEPAKQTEPKRQPEPKKVR